MVTNQQLEALRTDSSLRNWVIDFLLKKIAEDERENVIRTFPLVHSGNTPCVYDYVDYMKALESFIGDEKKMFDRFYKEMETIRYLYQIENETTVNFTGDLRWGLIYFALDQIAKELTRELGFEAKLVYW